MKQEESQQRSVLDMKREHLKEPRVVTVRTGKHPFAKVIMEVTGDLNNDAFSGGDEEVTLWIET